MKKYGAKKLPIKKIIYKKDSREYYLAEDAEAQISEYASVSIMLQKDVKRLSKAIKSLAHMNDPHCHCDACKEAIKLGIKKIKK